MPETGLRRELVKNRWLLSLAVVVTVGAAAWAWQLAATGFSPSPRLADRGVIAVALDANQTGVTAPVQVHVAYNPGTGKAGTTSLSLVLQHEIGAAPEAAPPTAAIVLICGDLATGIDMINRFNQPVKWKPVQPKSENSDYWSMLGGSMSRCVYTRVSLDSGDVGLRQEILSGISGITCKRASGPRLLYVLPGLTTLPHASAGEIAFRPLPPGSKAIIDLDNQPGDFSAQTASPQLPDSGVLRWTKELPGSAGPLSYRLSGELLDTAAIQQRNLFMAGALAGVAGGGIMLVLEAAVQLLLNRSRKRAAKPQAMAPLPHSQDRTEAPALITPPAAAPPPQRRDRSMSVAVAAAVGATAVLILLRRRRNRLWF
ncbi:hypothetical protein FHG89_32385 [Micromonospora orduensis]|uniref:Uncharacterized protein n=1 Tax=Micromonospora orduensis TaxID=1420891 RepID=A0A5C4Q7Q6_9ACTN|nr:hypothetical protein [Micromonospora orduensis]TNH21092.1 hypothetical protein FHG89_32385 [Micromonospora orduensis]